MKKSLIAALFGMILVLTACGGGGENEEQPAETGDAGTEQSGEGGTTDTAAAEEIFQNNCANCHGGDLSGGAGPDLREVGSAYSQEEIADIIQNGIGSMPAQSQVTGEDLEALSSWLAGMQ
ncbi:cytochrome c551 [Lentibacillus sediminis]|uniref:cytochrome c551 n=1 Tax=Lentibacillus sediminis TaxID=1940529 RepID=UPI000C1BCC1D|nr:cytochrome c [Lentibacillus sediminis]